MIKIALHSYIPQNYLDRADVDDAYMHFLVLDFKDGKNYAQEWAAKVVGKALSQRDRSDVVFMCIPASTHFQYVRRYERFSEMVCEICGCVNGFPHIFVSNDRMPSHVSKRERNRLNNVVMDADFFRGKKVIIFDDIITTGATANKMQEKLRECGANVIGALFLAKTFHPPKR